MLDDEVTPGQVPGQVPGPVNGAVGAAVPEPGDKDGAGRDGAGRDGAGRDGGGAIRVAAIDCGTNSLRLLIADADTGRAELTDVSRRMEIVRLGQGVDATGRLAADALERTFGVLREYAAMIDAAGVQAVRMVATSATRDAANAAEFTRGVKEIIGAAPDVLRGDQEARLSFAGATAELMPGRAGHAPAVTGEHGPPFLVTDIGGGSTEFVAGGGELPGRLAAISVDVGCVRLTERHLHADPPLPAQIAAATADIDAALAVVAAKIPVPATRTLVGLAGSVTTVAAIALGLASYDPALIHHAVITAGDVHAVTVDLLGRSRVERARIGVMHPGRVDVIGAGALLLDRVLSRFGFREVLVSEHDILDGIAWSVVTGDWPE